MKNIRPMIINVNAPIMYHCALHLQSSLLLILTNITSVPFIGWKAMPVTKAFSLACLHMICTVAAVAIIDNIAAINRKKSIM